MAPQLFYGDGIEKTWLAVTWFMNCAWHKAFVIGPLCLVESYTLDAAVWRERSLFTSHTFCHTNISCSLISKENISCVYLPVLLTEYVITIVVSSNQFHFPLLNATEYKKQGQFINKLFTLLKTCYKIINLCNPFINLLHAPLLWMEY